MKIIARVSSGYNSKFLVEIDSEEISMMTYGDRHKEPRNGFDIGHHFSVGDHWSRVNEINDAQDRLKRAAASIRAVAELIETIDVNVPKVEKAEENGGAK